jgi:hypothetical protein
LPHSPVAVEADRLDSEGVLVKVVDHDNADDTTW